MYRGVVMEIEGSDLVVMTPEGEFRRIPQGGRSCQIGDEVLFGAVSAAKRPGFLRWASAAAAAVVMALILLTGLPGMQKGSHTVVAYVTMDINPSIELGINENKEVIEVQGLNKDGIDLLHTLKLEGKQLETAASLIIAKAEETVLKDKSDGDIVVTSTTISNEAKLSDSAIVDTVKQQVAKNIKQWRPSEAEQFVVTALEAPAEVREEAAVNGVSTGKMLIYLRAKENGIPVEISQLQGKSIHEVAKEYGGIGKLLQGSAPLTKIEAAKLLNEEKSGELDKKVAEAKKKKDQGKGKASDPKKNDKVEPVKPVDTKPKDGSKKVDDSKKDGKVSDGKQQDGDKKSDDGKKHEDVKKEGDGKKPDDGKKSDDIKKEGDSKEADGKKSDGGKSHDGQNGGDKKDDNKSDGKKSDGKSGLPDWLSNTDHKEDHND